MKAWCTYTVEICVHTRIYWLCWRLDLVSSKHSNMQEIEGWTMSRDVQHQISILIIQKAWGYVTNKYDVINLNNKEVEEVQTFLYLPSSHNGQYRTDRKRCKEIKPRINQKFCFIPEQPIEISPIQHAQTNLRIVNTDVLFVLFYCSNLWRTTEKDKEKLDTFHRRCLRRMVRPNIKGAIKCK